VTLRFVKDVANLLKREMADVDSPGEAALVERMIKGMSDLFETHFAAFDRDRFLAATKGE
jgi:hypothetical protein